MIIPESSIQLTDIYSNETVNRLLQEAEAFLSRINQIDIVGQLKTVCSINLKFFFKIIFFVFRSFKSKELISIFYLVLI